MPAPANAPLTPKGKKLDQFSNFTFSAPTIITNVMVVTFKMVTTRLNFAESCRKCHIFFFPHQNKNYLNTHDENDGAYYNNNNRER